jgi:beta-glucanase (GH16 family)
MSSPSAPNPKRRSGRRKALLLLGMTTLAVVCAGTLIPMAAADSADVVAAPAATPVWSDDFEGPAGTAPDKNKWTPEIGNSPWGNDPEQRGWGNDELQYYTASTSNAAQDGKGHLVITAQKEKVPGSKCWYGACQYSSARLSTADGKFSQKYGRIEARIKMPTGKGQLPAFWMLSDSDSWPDGGEIDIAEYVGQNPQTAWGTVHGPGYVGREDLSFGYNVPKGTTIPDAFRVYAIDWSPNRIAWSVDGKEYGSVTPAQVKPGKWVFNDSNFHILLNLAIGGTWPGAPAAGETFPKRMEIDYVHAYAYSGK